MATEPERPIEKLLRAAATKRRDAVGGPFDLHPADRRLLQGEVARQFAKPQNEPRLQSPFLARLWSRFAWGLGILAVLGAAAWLMLRGADGGNSPSLLAKNQPVSAAMPAREVPPPAPSAPAVIPLLSGEAAPPKPAALAYAGKTQAEPQSSALVRGIEEKPIAKDTRRETAASRSVDKLPPSTAPQGADKEDAQVEIAAFSGSLKPAGGRVSQSASAYKSLPEAASANRRRDSSDAVSGVARFSGAALAPAKGAVISQRFAQVAPPNRKKPYLAEAAGAAHPVLGSFQMEQNGPELRIVDADGSVYSGYVKAADTSRPAQAIKEEAAASAPATRAPKQTLEDRSAARLDSGQAVVKAYFFRVTGASRSLNKKVVFTGNLLSADDAVLASPVVTNSGTGTAIGGGQGGSGLQFPLSLQNARISGKVVIGAAKAVEINAEPASP